MLVLHREIGCSNEKGHSVSGKRDFICTETEKMGVHGRTLEQVEWLICPCLLSFLGHSDVVMGLVSVNCDDLYERLKFLQNGE